MPSRRLQALASHYHQEPCIWDIGCDHGLLGLSLAHESQLSEIHFVDPALAVIEKLQSTIKDSHIPKNLSVFIHHKKGQEIEPGPERKLIFIAGMGGKEIRDILTHLTPYLSSQDRVVVSPHRRILELREFLFSSAYKLEQEYTVEEEGFFYQILCLNFTSPVNVSRFGIKVWQNEVGVRYRQHILQVFETHQDPHSKALVAYLKSLIP